MIKRIPNFEEHAVDELGNVYSFKRNRFTKLKPDPDKDGYLRFIAYKKGKMYTLKVHVCVVRTFIGEKPFTEAQVRHKNGINTDNNLSNLLWGTASENQVDSVNHGTCSAMKLDSKSVKQIRLEWACGESQKDLAKRYGVAPNTISYLINNINWKHV